MENIEKLVEGLSSPNNQYAYGCLKELAKESQLSDAAYPYFDSFIELMESGHTYRRTRGLLLIAYNAQWDEDGKLDGIMDKYLSHILDTSPTTARQCIEVVPLIAQAKPQYKEQIIQSLQNATTGQYKSSMAPLIAKDVAAALAKIG